MQQKEHPRTNLPAWAAAAILGGLYVGVAAIWILVSSWAVPELADTVPDAASIEILKGLVFVIVTGIGIFLLSWRGLRVRERLLTELLSWREASAASERQAIAGTLAGSVAHDINNVLMVLGVHLEDAPPPVQNGLRRLERLARDLQRLARPTTDTSTHVVDLHESVCEVIRFARGHRVLEGRALQVHGAEGHQVALPIVLFDRALLNLLLNAGEATGPEGRIVVRSGADDTFAWLSVEDDGEGVGGRSFEELAQPWNSSRLRGSGLGLVTVQAFSERIGGSVVVDTSPELGGARFALRWPRSQPSARGQGESEATDPAPSAGG